MPFEQAFDYYDAVVKSDISRADGVTRDPERVKRLMRSYARNQGSQVTNTFIKEDMAVNDSDSLDTDTVYLNFPSYMLDQGTGSLEVSLPRLVK